ncbi:MAG: nucleotidyl transferase AbiEii/AbiGii toxin family protein [Deltaproteobacteria bacterium]|nr:nucleotidyl transferase AbiEii/AbiGii toxin family protein [Deltaproteobacteria bacterium]
MREDISFDEIKTHLALAFENVEWASGIKIQFSRYDRHSHENRHTFFIAYEGPLPGTAVKEVKVDITIKEKIVFPVASNPVLKTNDEYNDLPDDAKISVYPITEITSEKISALLDPARNEPRDLYDLWYLSTNKYVALAELTGAVAQKMKFRGNELIDVKENFTRKEARLKKLWGVRLSVQMACLPEFDEVYRAALRELKQAGFLS